MKKISDHISYKEATHSNTAIQLGISNKPSAKEIKNMELIAEKVFEPLREWAGGPIKINSMFRSEEVNQAVRGSVRSNHLTGNAIDLTTLNGKSNSELFYYIKDNLDFHQLIWEFGSENPQWIHVSYLSKKDNKKQVLITRKKGKYFTFDDCKDCK
jgi:hypothetical protein